MVIQSWFRLLTTHRLRLIRQQPLYARHKRYARPLVLLGARGCVRSSPVEFSLERAVWASVDAGDDLG